MSAPERLTLHDMSSTPRLSWFLIFGVWSAIGVLLAIQTYITLPKMPESAYQLSQLVAAQMYRAWLWALLTPFVFILRREIARRHPRPLATGALHLLAAVTLLAWCNIIRMWLLNVTYGVFYLPAYGLDAILTMVGPRSLIDFYLYWLVMATGYVVDLSQQKRHTDLREEQLRTQLAQAELAALKQQVQPHFLFNSLNAISALMREGHTAKAVEAIALLSTLLRQLMAHGGRQEIELWRELDYVQTYLAVEKLRFEERLVTEFDADEECLHAAVPTLIVQPLVENAIKHGIAQRRNAGRLRVSAKRVGAMLRIEVFNDPAEGGRRASEHDNHGIGLQATRARLERAYPEKHRLDCRLGGDAGSTVILEIPFQARPAPVAAAT